MSSLHSKTTLIIRQRMLETMTAKYKNSDRPLATKAAKAIRRIKDGTYGYCISCGMYIPERDTEWRPERSHCSQCESTAREMEALTNQVII